MEQRVERVMRGVTARSGLVAIAVGCVLTAFACAGKDAGTDVGGGAGDSGPLVTGTDASTDPVPPPGETRRMCVATECPAPLATCPVDGVLPEFRCATDLSKDLAHCGSCGNSCGDIPAELHMFMSCEKGECEAICSPSYLDCNGVIDDGCETHISSNAEHCGGCGVRCPDGVKCKEGMCGCPPGRIECNGHCTNPELDDYNCGGCGIVCRDDDAGAVPANMYRGCVAGKCGSLKCDQRETEWTDCNGSLADGCEVNLVAQDDQGRFDPNNCGSCGRKCSPGTQCLALGTIDCYCKVGETLCGRSGCKDLETDPTNCGSCGFGCPEPVRVPENLAKGEITCRRGHCGYECRPGFASCNGRLDDGCETDLSRDPRNCGACGSACAANQPCVNGACVLRECPEEEVPK